jgi:hypothetical protein
MRKPKKAQNGRQRKPVRQTASKPSDPEWEFLEERFSSMSEDFSRLAEMMPQKDQQAG